jgi:hypothetical protein
MRRAVTTLVLALLAASSSCELGTFECRGVDPVSGGPLCFCTSNGVLCGHSGFEPCSTCEVPR